MHARVSGMPSMLQRHSQQAPMPHAAPFGLPASSMRRHRSPAASNAAATLWPSRADTDLPSKENVNSDGTRFPFRRARIGSSYSCRDNLFLTGIFGGTRLLCQSGNYKPRRGRFSTTREETVRITHVLGISVVAAVLSTGVLAADAPSTWNDIQSAKKFVACVVPAYQPYSWKDPGGEWHGFAVEMAKDVANSLHVGVDFVETSFKTVVLDLQSAKCHAFFGFNATPERALAIDFAGPLYTLGFGALDRQGFKAKGDRWADLNDAS